MPTKLFLLGALATILAIALAIAVIALVFTRVQRKALDQARTGAMEADKARIEQDAIESERRRILTEMHDIIAHSLAVMVAQADGGTYVAQDSEASKKVFETIADTGRAAVDETRRVLGILTSQPGMPELQPGPDHNNIEALVDNMKAAGMSVFLIRLGEIRTLPAGLGLTYYRVCQEALTNALRHGGDDVEVTVTENWRPQEVVVTITSTGGTPPATPSSGTQRGILGMNRRAASVGGTLTAGPYEQGFRVRLELPLPDGHTVPTLEAPELAKDGGGAGEPDGDHAGHGEQGGSHE
jgi:signal transduction histidine kinase